MLKDRSSSPSRLVQTPRALVDDAAAELVADVGGAGRVAASEALTAVAGEAIENYGGVGINWGYQIQLDFKRLTASAEPLDC